MADGRTKWQYWIWDPNTSWSEDEKRHRLPQDSDVELRSWPDVLNHLGARGWELVAVTDRPRDPLPGHLKIDMPRVFFYFKRQALDDDA